MKRFLGCIISLCIIFSLGKVYAEGTDKNNSPPDVSAKSAILICADSSQVIFAKNEHEQLPMASTTKIMTALLALEEAQYNNKDVIITDEMVRVEGSSMGLLPGNVVNLISLAQGMLLCSGNDAANSAAITIGEGDIGNFVKLMNEKAKQIGMENTCFVTPSGLDRPGHYSTAYDMAILASYAMENQSFCSIVSQKSMNVEFLNPPHVCNIKNHNRLLNLCPGCIGIKTGFTKKSGRCLVSCVQRDLKKLIAVTLNAGDDWNDHIKLFEYGFPQVETVTFDDSSVNISLPVVGGNCDYVVMSGGEPLNTTLKQSDTANVEKYIEVPYFTYAPVHKGEILGKIAYKLNSKTVHINNLTANQDIEYKFSKNISGNFFDFFKNLFNLRPGNIIN